MSWLDDVERALVELGADTQGSVDNDLSVQQPQAVDIASVLDSLFQAEDTSCVDTLDSLLAELDQTDQELLTVLRGHSTGTQVQSVTEA